ncbi:MAG: hypothetical protein COX43_03440 [Parcubacteria group bacterium CG23_combo_of_CG06-09_8_20_14_all_35_9]|nr:MAG: hypothetical protein COX43_03440 [Parcubacteria group bacterium CG23_combo_of_CG06-09_8_20_14_all_35_9]
MPELTSATQKLIRKYQIWHESLKPKREVVTIQVDEVASRVATFYEKIREVVDWREEHLMRRIAIERILKRRMFLKKNTENTAEPFVWELIRGGHFPNNKIPKEKIAKIQKLINKYAFILSGSPLPPKDKTKSEFYTQILEIAACEVEEVLAPYPRLRADALIEYMEQLMRERIKIGKKAQDFAKITEEEKNTQIYIATQQALFKLDSPIISYNLLKRWYPDWSNPSPITLKEITQNIHLILDNIEKSFSHPLASKFYKVCERYDTPCLLLGDVLSQEPTEIEEKIREPEILERLIKEVYLKRLKNLKLRVRRAAVYSTMSIFLTKGVLLYAVEIPFAKYVMGQCDRLAEVADILVPTFLMALLVVTIRPPKKKNLQLVIMKAKRYIYKDDKKDVYEIELYPKRGFIFKVIIGLFYLLSFGLCFGAIFWLLYWLNFPPLSYLIFIIFTSLIAFTGTKIRQRARELHVTEERDSFLNFILVPFSLPVIQLGKWLAARWKKYNIIAVIFNFLIDMPFLIFVELLEQWRYFIKEKKEEIH